MTFDGETYDHDRDSERLSKEFVRVFTFMADAEWHTLAEIAAVTGDPLPGISARIRDFRKAKFGGHTVDRRYVRDGLWEYRLTVQKQHSNTRRVPIFGQPETGAV